MLNFRYGPDGQVYVIDWYDMKACHHPNPAGHDRTNGRIYKISYGDNKPVRSICRKRAMRTGRAGSGEKRLVCAPFAANSAGTSGGRQIG